MLDAPSIPGSNKGSVIYLNTFILLAPSIFACISNLSPTNFYSSDIIPTA